MSQNTYFVHPRAPGVVYRTTDPNERARLRRRGWIKVRREWLDGDVGPTIMRVLAKAAEDGPYDVGGYPKPAAISPTIAPWFPIKEVR